MFIPSNAPWAHVTLYYASFFGANAILGMFGGWLDHERMVDVAQGTPGTQTLRVSRRLHSPSGYRGGSHKIFWDNFYEGCNQAIAPWIPTELAAAIAPVNGDRTWQTTARNIANYDMHGAYSGANFLSGNFNPKKLRLLAGELGQQREVTERMLKLAIYFAGVFKIHSYAYEGLGAGARAKVFRELVSKKAPQLVEQSEFRDLMFR
jgi:hypothetical protein